MTREFNSSVSTHSAPPQSLLFPNRTYGTRMQTPGAPAVPQVALDPGFRAMASTDRMIGAFVAAHDKMMSGR